MYLTGIPIYTWISHRQICPFLYHCSHILPKRCKCLFQRDPTKRETTVRKEQVIAMYQRLEEFLESEDFEDDFKKKS